MPNTDPAVVNYDDLPVNDDGTHVATVSPAGVPWDCPIGYIRRALEVDGYTLADTEVEAPPLAPPEFDPATNTVDEVNAHLQAAYDRGDVSEIERVLAAEGAGKNRTTITDPTGSPAGDNA